MKITDRQRTTAAYFQLQADASFSTASKDLGIPQHSLRRELEQLESSGAIEKYPLIDWFKLGFVEHDLFFSFQNQSQGEYKNVTNFLLACDGVSWLCELGGRYQLAISVLSRGATHAHSVLRAISNKFPDVLLHRDFSIAVNWTLYRRRYLSMDIPGPRSISVGPTLAPEEPGEAERKVISALCRCREFSVRAISQEAGMPSSTVNYNLDRLREKGIYRGLVYAIRSARFGYQPYRFHVSLRNYSIRGQRMIYSFAEESRNVTNLVERLGATDYSLGVEVEGSSSAFSLGQNLRDYLGPELAHLEILPVFDEHKFSFYPYTVSSLG